MILGAAACAYLALRYALAPRVLLGLLVLLVALGIASRLWSPTKRQLVPLGRTPALMVPCAVLLLAGHFIVYEPLHLIRAIAVALCGAYALCGLFALNRVDDTRLVSHRRWR